MSGNTILGGPSAADTTGEPEPDADPRDPAAVPGDTETAIHRSQLYALLSLGLERPGDDFAAAVADGAFENPLVESATAIDGTVADAARAVSEVVTDRDALHGDWASLFGVEEGLTVSPYELTYIPGPLMTNVRGIADIRGFYEAFGLGISEGQNDRADHVCFQTEFLGHLAEREAVLREHGDAEGVEVVVDAQRSFLEDHLGRWYWRLTDEVSKRDDGGFYAALAELLAALVEHEVERFELDPDWVPDDPAVTEWNEDVFGDTGRGCGGCGADTEGMDDAFPEGVPAKPPDQSE